MYQNIDDKRRAIVKKFVKEAGSPLTEEEVYRTVKSMIPDAEIVERNETHLVYIMKMAIEMSIASTLIKRNRFQLDRILRDQVLTGESVFKILADDMGIARALKAKDMCPAIANHIIRMFPIKP